MSKTWQQTSLEIAQVLSKFNFPEEKPVETYAKKLADEVIEEWTKELISSNYIQNQDSANGLKFYIYEALLEISNFTKQQNDKYN